MAPPTRSHAPEDSPTAVHEPVAPPPTPAPAALNGAASTDRCANCGSLLAADQRYCLECGERRGAGRFNPRPSSAATTVATTTSGPPRGAPRLSGGSTLIAGIGTLLLAMGIGVLIGRDGSTSASPSNSKVQVVQVPGGSGVAASTASTPAASTGGSTGSGHHKSGKAHSKKKAASTTHLSAANATQTVKSLPPPTVTVGQKGSGPGYTKGHFTGNFFGP